jgi:purine-binding chemotaxis protein CheW
VDIDPGFGTDGPGIFAGCRDQSECSGGIAPRDRTTMTAINALSEAAAGRESGSRNAPNVQLVGFRLDGDDYAIPITRIQEIILMKPVTRIPQVPAFIEGLINLRGVVIPLINLRTRFGLAPREVDDETRTIVLNLHDRTIGCIVDAVTQVMRLAGDQIQPTPTTIASVARNYISGLARLEDRLLIVLDVEKLFDPSELAIEVSR